MEPIAHDVSGSDSTILLIDEGDLPSLTALTMQPERAQLVLWHQSDDEASAERRLHVVRQHERLSGGELLLTTAWSEPGGSAAAPRRLRRGLVLAQASIVASRHGCGHIVWPVQVGDDPAAVCEAVDTATCIMELAEAEVESGERRQGRGITIDLPLVDLTEAQVVDLADDAGAPMRGFWPCQEGGAEPCGRCGECRRWSAGFAEVGLPWPWARTPSSA